MLRAALDSAAPYAEFFESLECRTLMSRVSFAGPLRDAVSSATTLTVKPTTPSATKKPTSSGSSSNLGGTSTSGIPSTGDTGLSSLVTPGTRPLALQAQALTGGGVRLYWDSLGLDSTGEIVVFRKPLTADQWDETAIGLPGFAATEFIDTTAVTGIGYEYKVVVYTTLGAAPYEKYIYAGNQVAPVSSRGSVLLVVDETQLDTTRDGTGTTLAPALKQYKADLIAEGYRVFQITAPRVDVPRTYPNAVDPQNPTPEEIAAHSATWFNAVTSVKAQIRSLWQTVGDLKSVLLLGRVPVPYSGFTSPDVTIGHEQSLGAWAADVYYGVLSSPDSLWWDYATIGTFDAHINLPGDGKFDHDSLSQIGYGDPQYENSVFADVTVGRVDFSMLDNFTGVNQLVGQKASVAETNLLSRYLQKTHEYKTGQWDVRRKALFEEAFPFGEYYDTNRLVPNVGKDNVELGTVSPYEPSLVFFDDPYPVGTPPPTQYDLHNNSWMWIYTGAGGFPSRTTLQYNPHRQLRSDQYSNGVWASASDFTKNNNFGNHKAVFNYIYGSYVGDWDYRNNLLRTVIAEPDGYGLVSMWGARPVWDQHHMGLGEPLSTSVLKTWNNFGTKQVYAFDPNSSSTRQSVLGDPTLRQDNLKPASHVRFDSWGAGGTLVHWDASADAGVSGYYIYRADAIDGSYTLLNSSPVSSLTYLDTSSNNPNGKSYLVRATKLETTPSGTYWNLALGAYSAPAVVGATFNSGDRPHSVDLTFSQDVGSSIATGDFVISGSRYNFNTGLSEPTTFVAGVDFHLASYNPTTRTARILFDMSNEMGLSQMIPSGRYNVSFAPGSVTNEVGEAIDSSYSFQIAFLAGDTNGDLVVNFDDLLKVAQSYGSSVSVSPFASGDFNDDGIVNFDDLLLLAQHYGARL